MLVAATVYRERIKESPVPFGCSAVNARRAWSLISCICSPRAQTNSRDPAAHPAALKRNSLNKQSRSLIGFFSEWYQPKSPTSLIPLNSTHPNLKGWGSRQVLLFTFPLLSPPHHRVSALSLSGPSYLASSTAPPASPPPNKDTHLSRVIRNLMDSSLLLLERLFMIKSHLESHPAPIMCHQSMEISSFCCTNTENVLRIKQYV